MQEESGVVHAQVVANGQFGWLAFGNLAPHLAPALTPNLTVP